MKFLIAGLGSIGRRHLRNLLELGERDIVLYRTRQGTLDDDEEFGAFPEENTLEKAFNHQPDAVIVSNPTAFHLDVAIMAAKRGAHILLEKPVSHSMHHVDELLTAVSHSGSEVLVGYQFRYHPSLKKIAELLSAGTIGRPLSVRAQWGEYLPNWHPWENYQQSYSARSDLGGGVILTLSHPIDYLRWLLGDFQSLWAFSGQLSDLDIDVEDMAEIGILFENGTIGSLHLDYVQQPPTHNLEIIGTRGVIRWDYYQGDVHVYDGTAKHWNVFSIDSGFVRNDMFLDEMRHFIAVTRGEEESICTLEDGIQALKIALAAVQSSREGKMISLSPRA